LDDEVESKENSLAALIAQIRGALGVDLRDRFRSEFEKMHPEASGYSVAKLDEGDSTVKGATSWPNVRNWLLAEGMIFRQPLTQTTTYVKNVAQPQAEYAADAALADKCEELGIDIVDLESKLGMKKSNAASEVVEKSRSQVNAGAGTFSLAKAVLQEFAFSEKVRPFLTLRSVYLDSDAVARALGLGPVQLHHLVTERMVAQLKASQPQLNPQQLRDNVKYQANSSPGGHFGYEKWHRHYDSEMKATISKYPPGQMQLSDLVLMIHNYYQSDHGFNITKKIPNVNLL
jgi:hypothetical protein